MEQPYRNARIMLVDDYRPNILLLEKLLKQQGFTNIQTTMDSRDVMGLYQSFQPHLMLLDLRMPHLDGFDILTLLHDEIHLKSFPVIVVTAQDDKEHKHRSLKLGARDFIAKPFDREEVLVRIENTLEMQCLHAKMQEENEKLETVVHQQSKELEETQIELIRRLGRAAESKDAETGLHIIRMSLYTREIAKTLGYSDDDLEFIQHASSMHDIGKIGIPDEILLKPGPLNAAEWETMKTHTIRGGQILSGSTSRMLKMAEEIALTHHEKWDGTGYPYQKAGEEIPLLGRIAAVADVFDALTSDRPYKKAWTFENAVDEIKRSSGQHFDPRIVEAFVRTLPAIQDIYTLYKEVADPV